MRRLLYLLAKSTGQWIYTHVGSGGYAKAGGIKEIKIRI